MVEVMTFVTGNKLKFENAKHLFDQENIKLIQETVDAPEIQADSAQEVAVFTTRYLSKRLKIPFFVMDRSFHITCLNGFPGPYIKQVNTWLSSEHFVRLVEGYDDLSATWLTSIGLFLPGQEPKIFMGENKGLIIKRPDLNKKVDYIFLPEGSEKTLGEYSPREYQEFWNKTSCWRELLDFIKSI